MDVAMSKISANGQIVIPADIRQRLGIEGGTKFLIIEERGNLVLKPLRGDELEEAFGSVLDRLHRAFREAGLDRETVEDELAAHRSG